MHGIPSLYNSSVNVKFAYWKARVNDVYRVNWITLNSANSVVLFVISSGDMTCDKCLPCFVLFTDGFIVCTSMFVHM